MFYLSKNDDYGWSVKPRTIKELLGLIENAYKQSKKEYGFKSSEIGNDYYDIVVDNTIVAIVQCNKPTFRKRLENLIRS